MADPMQVELVAADRVVWSGEATQIVARTVEGEVGVLAGHQPMLAVLAEGAVVIDSVESETLVAAVDAGFLSVANNRVSILADEAVLAHDVDLEQARRDLEQAQRDVEQARAADTDDEEAAARLRRAQSQVRAAERAR